MHCLLLFYFTLCFWRVMIGWVASDKGDVNRCRICDEKSLHYQRLFDKNRKQRCLRSDKAGEGDGGGGGFPLSALQENF